jgi:phosphoribosylanthranilate isomerase
MKKTIIQIYEVQKPKEAQALVDLGVNHIGSVLVDQVRWKKSAIRKTVQAIQQSGARSGLIPLFRDPLTIFQAIDHYRPDFVHFCEVLSPFGEDHATMVREYDAMLSLQLDVRDRFPQVDIMRSLSVPLPGLPQTDEIRKNILGFAEHFAPFSDYFLIDTLIWNPSGESRQPVPGYVGITGAVCDWNLARAVIEASPIPVILAGGLSGENVFDAIIRLKPAGVDSCTKTNALDRNGRPVRFKKDMKKVSRFIDEVRRADRFVQGEGFAEKCVDAKRI